MSKSLIDAFDIRSGELIAIVGGGGKSSLLFAIERGWDQPIVITTTTRIFAAQIARARSYVSLNEVDQLDSRLDTYRSCLVIGETIGDKAYGVPIEWPKRLLMRPTVDLVAVEADGSRMRPVKAPASHEPVVPFETTVGIIVVGVDALERPIEDVAHRPEIVCQLTGLHPSQKLTPFDLAHLLTHPLGGIKNMPASARVTVCINKVETTYHHDLATQIAASLLTGRRVESVVITALHPEIKVHRIFEQRP